MNSIITLREYLNKGKVFVIPDYQRGYIWGKNRPGEKNSVEHLLDNLLENYCNQSQIFLQGFTVTEKEDRIIIVDGQQRTTFLYLLLRYLNYYGKFSIKYAIREETSGEFLRNVNSSTDCKEDVNEEYQDVYFFKKTLRIIQGKLENGIDKEDFIEFLLDKVKFLYINITERQSNKVFTMMNGSKADMLTEEIIKAEILRLASDCNDQPMDLSIEWENNMLRSRYAREWDKWLHWWNRKSVQKVFLCSNTMGLLISSYALSSTRDSSKLTFELFKKSFLNSGKAKDAKDTFDQLRRLQKRFEDAFNNAQTHNMVGAILRLTSNKDEFIKYFFVDDNRNQINQYYQLTFLGMTHKEIVEFLNDRSCRKTFDEKFNDTLQRISDDFIYTSENKELAFRLLLRLNIDEDNKQNQGEGRFFDFSIWENGVRSLEHIMPKSLVGHYDQTDKCWKGGDGQIKEEGDFDFKRDLIHFGDTITTEHSIGNLVLLYKDENSKFSNFIFQDKKNLFFSTEKNEYFKSRHLLHTIYTFSKSDWKESDIAENKSRIIKNFITYYEPFNEQEHDEKQD